MELQVKFQKINIIKTDLYYSINLISLIFSKQKMKILILILIFTSYTKAFYISHRGKIQFCFQCFLKILSLVEFENSKDKGSFLNYSVSFNKETKHEYPKDFVYSFHDDKTRLLQYKFVQNTVENEPKVFVGSDSGGYSKYDKRTVRNC